MDKRVNSVGVGGGRGCFSRCCTFCCETIRDPRVIVGLSALLLFVGAFGFGFLGGFLSHTGTGPTLPPQPAYKVTFLILYF